MYKLDQKDHRQRVDSLVELAESRAKKQDYVGVVHLDDWLTPEEVKLLSESLRALPFHNPKRLPPEIIASIPEHLRS